ncbi:hypothetical protein [Nocardioides mangrovi]|uniref:Alpha/beta hydrolase n=1 Tax=Nocardioides mangrovi TaxID=2874580 RepID=A0ABS7UDF9_9ACTN|nr:hypothetical protein [Nocardioides mangrovi]MBZ5739021.1 hypothetical protein [Nocardioides mangrovi]
MSAPERADITDVRGGVGGLAAAYDEVRALADLYDEAGDRLREWSGLGVRALADPDLITSAALAPATFALAEGAVVAATTGPDGVLVESCGWEADAVLVRAALDGIAAADAMTEVAVGELDRRLGLALGTALRLGAPLLPVARPLVDRLPVEDVVHDHPGLVEHLVDGGGGLVGGLLGTGLITPDLRSGARLLATPYGDGTAVTRPRPDLTGRVESGRQPDSVAGLVRRLRRVAALSPEPDSRDNGTIEVESLDAGTDRARHIVYLPGTDDLETLPWTQDDDVRDLGTDLRLIAGEDDAYRRGILDAMHQAGIGPHEPVLLVGHSQGGMEAASILGHGSGFDVTHVVTAGSPTAQVDGFPTGSHVLSLEHRGDLVPLLDGAPNPDTVGQTTVTFEDGGDSLVDRHSYGHYVAGAEAVDRSTDPTVVEQLESLRAHGFLADPGGSSASVTSQVFQVVRAP